MRHHTLYIFKPSMKVMFLGGARVLASTTGCVIQQPQRHRRPGAARLNQAHMMQPCLHYPPKVLRYAVVPDDTQSKKQEMSLCKAGVLYQP